MTGLPLDLDDLSNTELIRLVEIPATHPDGLRYYLSKAAKLALLKGCSREEAEQHLAAARKAQMDHHARIRANQRAGRPDRASRIVAAMGEDTWTYVGRANHAEGFRDAATGRKARQAFTLRSIRTGRALEVTRSTVEYLHLQVRPVGNWPPRAGRPSMVAAEAARAGMTTMASATRRA